MTLRDEIERAIAAEDGRAFSASLTDAVMEVLDAHPMHLSAYVDAAGILASDPPGVVVRKLQAVIDARAAHPIEGSVTPSFLRRQLGMPEAQ